MSILYFLNHMRIVVTIVILVAGLALSGMILGQEPLTLRVDVSLVTLDVEVSDVDGIEGAAEQTQAHHSTAAATPATSCHIASTSASTPSPVTAEIG